MTELMKVFISKILTKTLSKELKMKNKIKKLLKVKSSSNIFKDIDAKLLVGWECINYSLKQKQYIENMRLQTHLAMENQKFKIFPE
tara:strand:- start:9959 stop:10216 length:258 start_codon:yes stop_codon:yes gene_type:complete